MAALCAPRGHGGGGGGGGSSPKGPEQSGSHDFQEGTSELSKELLAEAAANQAREDAASADSLLETGVTGPVGIAGNPGHRGNPGVAGISGGPGTGEHGDESGDEGEMGMPSGMSDRDRDYWRQLGETFDLFRFFGYVKAGEIGRPPTHKANLKNGFPTIDGAPPAPELTEAGDKTPEFFQWVCQWCQPGVAEEKYLGRKVAGNLVTQQTIDRVREARKPTAKKA